MVQMLVQIDEGLARELERVVPGRSRKRSEFVRMAIQRALMDLQEERTRRAYEAQPDDEPYYFDPAAWTARRRRKPKQKKK